MVAWKNAPDLSTPLDADHLTQAFDDERASERAYQSSTYGTVGSTYARRRPWKPAAATNLVYSTKFAAGHVWTAQPGNGTVNLNDTSVASPFGAQAVSITPGPGTAYDTSILSGMATIDLTSSALMVCVKFDPTTDTSLQVFVGDVGLSNTYSWAVGTPSAVGPGGWTWIELLKERGAVTGTPAASGSLRIKIQTLQGGAPISVGAVATRPLPTSLYPNGVVVFTFDDSVEAAYTHARPKLAQYGYPACLFVIVDQVDTGGLTTPQAQELQNVSEWEIGLHSYTTTAHNARYTTLTTPQVEAEFVGGIAWLRANGFPSESWASPGGSSNEAVWAVAKRYVNLHRSAGGHADYLGQLYSPQIATPEQVLALTFDAAQAPISMLTSAITKTVASKTMLVINLHDITTAASSGEEISDADFATLVDACNSAGIAVRTFAQIQAELDAASDALDAKIAAQHTADVAVFANVAEPIGTLAATLATANEVTSGESAIPRIGGLSANHTAAGTGALLLSCFTARKTETITQIRAYSGSTAAAATPTLARMGVFTVVGSAITLVASTASDTTLFAAVNTAYTRTLTVPLSKVAGQRYALGILVVSAAACPSYIGGPALLSAGVSDYSDSPPLNGWVSGQTDLPTTASMASTSRYPQLRLLP